MEEIKTAKCTAKTVRVTPRKARLVIDLVRGKSASEASAILRLTPNAASVAIGKVLTSAAANAVNNLHMVKENLYIKEAYVNEGPTMKRFLPRAKGSADRLLKRTSHITIVLAEKN
ncbi:50S ribosomal protein L22 [Coprobacillus sp. CAG:698]|nr:50S ribosomal protein L22 [Coprobacillus sp. CAG:698]